MAQVQPPPIRTQLTNLDSSVNFNWAQFFYELWRAVNGLTVGGSTVGGSTITQVIVTSSPASSITNSRVVANGASLVIIPLPTVQEEGDVFKVAGAGAGGWQISQAAGQKIYFGNMSTTTGASGYIASTDKLDNVTLEYTAELTAWVVSAVIGNLTVA